MSTSIYLATRAAIDLAIQADDTAPVFVRLASGSWLRLRDDVPATRGACPEERPCPHYKCRQHLFLSIGIERAGRRVNGKPPSSTLKPLWRSSAPSCTLDIADEGATSVEDTGKHMGLEPSQVHAFEASALKKLRALGVPLEELLP